MKPIQRSAHFLYRARAVPLRAYPRVIGHRLRRQWAARTAPASPSVLSDADLLRFFWQPDRAALLAAFRERATLQFFVTDPAGRAALVTETSPGLLERLRIRGEAILSHHFDLLGSGPIDLGPNIPWRRDFISGHEWPCEHFSRLTIVDLDAGFDVKVPWELSRFYHASALGQCYALTGEARYAEEFVAQLTHWWAENPVEFGPNWANAMEAAIRAANLIWGYELLRGAPAFDDDFTLRFLKSLIQHGRYIVRHLESGWPGSNHFLADLCGLVWLGLYLSPAPEAVEWMRRGLRLLAREVKTQVHPDGADYEASSSYHLLVTEMLLWTVAFCDLNGVDVPHILRTCLAAMLDVIAGLLRPDGNLPLFGDCDSGRWLALESDTDELPSVQDSRGVLALGAVMFDRPDRAALVGGKERWEAALWAFGEEAATMLHRQVPLSRAAGEGLGVGVAFPHAGWYIMRHDEHYLAVEAGNLGADGWGLHDHNDALSFELAVGERVFLIDPGSYAYTGDYRARNEFRSTAAHNTVRVGGRELNRIPERDMFRLENDARVTVLDWHVDGDQAWFDAECVTRSGGWRHRRRIEYQRDPGCWLITDRVEESPITNYQLPISVEAFFHFAPLPVQLDGLVAWTTCESGPNLALLPVGAAQPGLAAALEEGWYAPRYGVRRPAPVVRYYCTQAGSVRIDFALLPFAGPVDLRRARTVAAHMVKSLARR